MTNDTTTTTMTPTRTEEPTREERTKEARALHPSVHPQTAATLRRLYLSSQRARCAYGHLGPVARKHHERGYAEGRNEVALQILDAMIALLRIDQPSFHRGDVLQTMYFIAGED